MDKLPSRQRTKSLNFDEVQNILPSFQPFPDQKPTEKNKSQRLLNSAIPVIYPEISLDTSTNQREKDFSESIQYLKDYKTREKAFLNSLKQTITTDCNDILKRDSEFEKSTNESKSNSIKSSLSFNLQPDNYTLATNHRLSSERTSIDSSSQSTYGLSATSSFASNKTSSSDELTATASSELNTKLLKSKIISQTPYSDCDLLKDECDQFINPLLNRTSSTITAVLSAYDAIEQLNTLHRLVDQMLSLEERNYQMKKHLRDVKTLCELKRLQSKDYFNESNGIGDIFDNELDLNNRSGILNTILAAGNTASSKRNSSKRQKRERSKSVICDEFSKENIKVSSTPRRQSAYSGDTNKSKVSKWTKVKAAFKWEKANIQTFEQTLSLSENQLKPINNEVARYLCVPAPFPINASSADSILSSSIPPTPPTISSASSTDDVRRTSEERRDSTKSDTRLDTQLNNIEDSNRRSRSLENDTNLSLISNPVQKTKTPWKKVKNIIQTHRGSLKNKARSRSIKSSNSNGKESRDISPVDFSVVGSDEKLILSEESHNIYNIISPSSSLTSANSQKGTTSGPSSPTIIQLAGSIPFLGEELKTKCSPVKSIRKCKISSGFESLPEGIKVDNTSKFNKDLNQNRPTLLNLNTKMNLCDNQFSDLTHSSMILQKTQSKILSNKKCLTSAGNSSVPSSPSRHSEFFAEIESDSGDYSEPISQSTEFCERLNYQMQQKEINEKYLELKDKLNKEFQAKRKEWEKIRHSCSSSSSLAHQMLYSNDYLQSSKSIPPKLLEENLSPDFKKKLHKWRNKKLETTAAIKDSYNSSPKGEKIDWNLWKTGQFKLEGQGLSPLPDQKSLPEEFQKKLEQWKKIKDTKAIASYSSDNQNPLRRSSGKVKMGIKSEDMTKKSKDECKSDKEKLRHEKDKWIKSYDKEKLEKLSKLRSIVTEPKIKEIEIQTSAGVMKFEGISRKFTRKLYEWEKAKGIGPESSTFAFLYPGYKPVSLANNDVETRFLNEPSSTLSRSLSLDSISPLQSMPSVSNQPSCLSFNHANEFRDKENSVNENRRFSSNLELCQIHLFDEDKHNFSENIDEHVKMLKMPDKEKRKKKRLRTQNSFHIDECSTNSTPLGDRNFDEIDNTITDFCKAFEALEFFEDKLVQNIQNALNILKKLINSIPDLEKKLHPLNKLGKDAVDSIKTNLSKLILQCEELNLDEACSQQLLDERKELIKTNLHDLQRNIVLVCTSAQNFQSETIIPKINVTSEDDTSKRKPLWKNFTTAIVNHNSEIKNVTTKHDIGSNTLLSSIQKHESTDKTLSENIETSNLILKPKPVLPEYVADTSRPKINRNSSNGSRKKSRLKKIGSRQNSKTESDSTDDEVVNNNEVTQRRLKRRLSRNKKSFDEDKTDLNMNDEYPIKNNTSNKNENNCGGEDVLYVLKIKAGQPIEQSKICESKNDSSSNICSISSKEISNDLIKNVCHGNTSIEEKNVFVRTKRNFFSAPKQTSETGSDSGIGPIIISRDLDSSTTTEMLETEDSCRDSTSLKIVPHVIENCNQMSSLGIDPCSSINLMVAKYKKRIESKKTNISPFRSGICLLSSSKSPVTDSKILKVQTDILEKNLKSIFKTASTNNIIRSKSLQTNEISLKTKREVNKITKSFSLEDVLLFNLSDVLHTDKAPLACDSLQNVNKRTENLNYLNNYHTLKEHLFKKNKEKPNNLIVSKSGALRKIDFKQKSEKLRIRSSSTEEKLKICSDQYDNVPDKADNTVPKITRKLENKATTPTEKSHPLSAELWHPLLPIPNKSLYIMNERPKTPLNERAIRLARAKEEFLREIPLRSQSFRKNSIDRKLDCEWNNQRFSTASLESELDNENLALIKCVSVGRMEETSDKTFETDHDENNFDESERYVSLPRSISRSAKFSSKLGFANLASKFRKVKMRREFRDEASNQMSSISELCRQSIALNVTQTNKNEQNNQFMSNCKKKIINSPNNTCEFSGIVKSKSSHAGSFGTLFKLKEKSKDSKKDLKNNGNKNDDMIKSKSAILPISTKNK